MLGRVSGLLTQNLSRQIVRHGSHGGVPGANLPFSLQNKYKLTALFIAFFGSGLGAPFLIVRHEMTLLIASLKFAKALRLYFEEYTYQHINMYAAYKPYLIWKTVVGAGKQQCAMREPESFQLKRNSSLPWATKIDDDFCKKTWTGELPEYSRGITTIVPLATPFGYFMETEGQSSLASAIRGLSMNSINITMAGSIAKLVQTYIKEEN